MSGNGYGTDEEYKKIDFKIDYPLRLLDLLGLSMNQFDEGSIALKANGTNGG